MDSEAQRSPQAGGHYLVCIAGPDQGKRVLLTTTALFVGHSADNNLLSDDPDVTDRFASVQMESGRLRVKGLTQPLPFVDGHAVSDAIVSRGQQLRMGRSLWEMQGPSGPSVMDFVNRVGDHLSNAAGIEKPGEWNAREMFADVAKKHSDEEVESYFTVGTMSTTPSLSEINTDWPKPWIFMRVFAVSIALYVGFLFAWNTFDNMNLIPGLIMLGSVAVPLSLLIFFFEVNVPRNVSLYQLIKLLLTGGLVSIVISLFFFQWTGLSSWLGAASAGIIEEWGKALTLLLVVRKPRFRWTLNGLLLGATVGTGFAVFESAGYALRAALGYNGSQAMRDTIFQRGILSVVGGHVLWTGLVGAALWRVRGDRPFSRDMLTDPKFLRVIGVCMLMHMIWNSNFTVPIFGDFGKFVLLGAAAWLLVLGMVQSGLKQVRDAKAEVSERKFNTGLRCMTAGAPPKFFATPVVFRAWLEKNHLTKTELLVGFYKRGSGKKSITWPESVDEALCFGWIDGVRRNVDETSYSIRFSPRRQTSTWSSVNINRVAELAEAGLMHPAGIAAFERRLEYRSRIYSYERRKELSFLPDHEKRFKANKKAWTWFQEQPPGYKHLMTFWVLDAKRDETRDKRIVILIDASASGKRLR